MQYKFNEWYLYNIVVFWAAPEAPMTSVVDGVKVNEHEVRLVLVDYVSKVCSC